MQIYRVKTEHRLFVDELLDNPNLKTGDLILFKAYDNWNSLVHGSYYGHIGMVFISPTGTPMLFEANGIERTPLKEHHSKSGIFLTPLADRIRKYKGRCFWKPLNKPLSQDTIDEFEQFIKYAMSEFRYEYSVFRNAIKIYLGVKYCDKKTDCGQLVYLSLIKTKLIDIDDYEVGKLHYLRYVTGLKELSGGYKYLDIIEVYDHPFAE